MDIITISKLKLSPFPTKPKNDTLGISDVLVRFILFFSRSILILQITVIFAFVLVHGNQ